MEYIPAKTIVTRTKSGEWFGHDYNMNIYKGCCHGCIYCDSRSECYGIEEFDRVRAKENALQIIRDDLRRKVKKGVVGMGAMSDPYNPFEEKLELTRHSLELLSAYGFGASVATKSPLIARDIDIFKEIKEHSPVLCKITITTIYDELSKKIERNVAPSSKRFETVAALSDAGLFSGVLLMPVLPFLEDTRENITGIVKAAKEAGARFIYASFGVTLRQNQRLWFFDRLEESFPGEDLVNQYKKRYGNNYSCGSPKARKLYELYVGECEKNGLLYKMKDIIRAYKRNYEFEQIHLFDLM